MEDYYIESDTLPLNLLVPAVLEDRCAWDVVSEGGREWKGWIGSVASSVIRIKSQVKTVRYFIREGRLPPR